MKNITISLDLANKILNYLATKPFMEVAQLINELQASAPKPEPTPSEDK